MFVYVGSAISSVGSAQSVGRDQLVKVKVKANLTAHWETQATFLQKWTLDTALFTLRLFLG